MTSRVAVTGAAGKIGSKIVPSLRAAGFEVTQFVRVSDPSNAVDASIRPVDLTDATQVEHELREARTDVLLHLAAALPSAMVARDDHAMAEALVQAAGRTSVSRIVFASSASVYGDRVDTPLTETRDVDPRSPYALAKLAAEEAFANASVETLILRMFNVFGPGLEHSLVAKLCEATAEHPFEPVAIDSFVRDYVHLDDVTRAFTAALEAELPDRHTVVNVGTGQRLSTRELIAALERFRPIHVAPRPGESSWSWADTSRMQSVLGLETDRRPERFDPAGFATPPAGPR